MTPDDLISLHIVAGVIVTAGVMFGAWGVLDCSLDRLAVRRSGENGLMKESANERWQASWLVLLGQSIHAVETGFIVSVNHSAGGHVALAAVTVVCGILMVKTVLRRRSRRRMRALYAQGHR